MLVTNTIWQLKPTRNFSHPVIKVRSVNRNLVHFNDSASPVTVDTFLANFDFIKEIANYYDYQIETQRHNYYQSLDMALSVTSNMPRALLDLQRFMALTQRRGV